MPANRITALLRSIADYRVEACFLAALVFTLGHNAFHHGPVEIRTTTTHERVVHEAVPVRVAAARRATHVRHPEIVGITAPTARPVVVGTGSDRKIVFRHRSDRTGPCAGSPALAPAAIGEGGSCKLIRVAPAAPRRAPAVASPRTFANGG